VDRGYLAEVETGKIKICLRNLQLVALTFDLPMHKLVDFPNHSTAGSTSLRDRSHLRNESSRLDAAREVGMLRRCEF
jgi:hypothetical protein